MRLLKLARSYVVKIKNASINNYKALLEANSLAQSAKIDPYDDLSSKEIKSLEDLAKKIAILTDNAYRKGVSATEIRYFTDGAHKLLKDIYMAPTTSQSTKAELGKLSEALLKVQYVDIPAQMQQIPPSPAPKTPSDQFDAGVGNAATKKSINIDLPEIEQLQQKQPDHYVDYFNP